MSLTSIRELNPIIPIIALTANAFDADRVSAMEAGCTMFSCILTSHGIHAQKVEPTPGVEVNPISPPAPSIIAREMANPSPVPQEGKVQSGKSIR